jgi:IstB-like ATP binding protein
VETATAALHAFASVVTVFIAVWVKIFPDQAMTLAAIDRLVHHATILEMNVESYRRRAALDRKRGPGRPPTHATIKEKT